MPDGLMDILWRNALGVVPLVLVVAAACRFVPMRPATRHTLWLMALAWLFVAPFAPGLGVAEYVIERVESSRRASEAGVVVAEAGEAPATVGAGEVEPAAAGLKPRTRFEGATTRVMPPAPIESLRANASREWDGEGGGVQAIEDRRGAPLPRFGPPASKARAAAPRSEPQNSKAAARALEAAPLARAIEDAAPSATSTWAPAQVSAAIATEDEEAYVAAEAGAAARDASNVLQEEIAASGSPSEDVASLVVEERADSGGIAAPVTPAARGPRMDWSALRSAAGEWPARLLAVRDAIVALPAAPPGVWMFGSALIVAVTAGRIVWFRRVFRSATPAPAAVTRMVDEAAATLGLRRAPRTVMVDDRVSPMIWCGRRARLVLPTELWEELDEIGRSAVIHHELAHLKRRDHWTRWAELAIGAVYWWHPAVWWIRRRLREEADLSCDAWVIALMPERRRAYAHALLRTRMYLGEAGRSAPAAGLGATSAGAKRFARRLTMVMTGRVKPRASFLGLALAGALGFAGTVATPLWACPPDKEKNKEKRSAHAAPAAPEAPAAPRAARAPRAPQAPHGEGDEAMSTIERHMLERERAARGEGGHAHGDGMEHRLESLEQRLERMMRTLERLHGEMGQKEGHGSVTAAPRAPGTPRAPQHSGAPGRAWVFSTPGAPAHGGALPRHGAQGGAVQAAPAPRMRTPEAGGNLEARVYALPRPQLQALTELMVRPDVPIRVRPLDNGLEVHATASQHETFGRFIEVISAPHEKHVYRVSGGKLEALTKLMALESVPIFIRRGDGQVTVYGSPGEQRVFSGFISLIEPEGRQEEQGRATGAGGAVAPEAPKAAGARGAGLQASVISEVAARAAALARESAKIRMEQLAMERRAEQLECEADGCEDGAEALGEASEALAAELEALRARTAGLDETARAAIREQAEVMARERSRVQQEHEALRQRSKAIREEARAATKAMREGERQAERLEREAEALGESLQERVEELMEKELDAATGEELSRAIEELVRGIQEVAEWSGAESADAR